ncbi:flavin-binding monooxygenase [Lecanosticta acicola]|uniref:Flavin-binding monooxygenase n=1 Tax=Lecanosticta acicola TaxID=111012 RepID=A0AAI9E9Q4_9PEZI|nr:flavin-binding monooxygenase [Lecanosticta acicola]
MHIERPRQVDLVVVGAGIYGIQAARTYLEVHPKSKVVILEASTTIGGVWSRDRVYEDFWTQTPVGILEFSSRPIHEIPDSDKYHGFFKAKHVTSYLEEYCRDQQYDNKSIDSRIRFGTSVQEISKHGPWWTVRAGENGEVEFQAPQIIDATGLTSTPNCPDLPDRESFKGRILHHKDFAKFEAELKAEEVTNVVVIGGAKSAADVAYSCAKAGHKVSWIIRKSGSGPAAFVSAKGSMGYANSNESFYTRLTSLFLVSLFALQMGYLRILNWLNRTRVGQSLLQSAWKRINARACKEADYDREDGQANGFHNLEPDTELFWQNDSTGINQREDFFDVIAKHVKVFRQDISGMDEHVVILQDSDHTLVRADVVICATGWRDQVSYFDDETSYALGLPANHRPAADSRWTQLMRAADEDVAKQFPILDSKWARSQKAFQPFDAPEQPQFRLWKSMVPSNDHSIVFLGRLMLGNHFRASEVQALFAVAVLDGAIKSPLKEDMESDIARTLAWFRRRYLKKGQRGNWFYWDMVPYTDMLLSEMGLRSHRSKFWLRDLTRPCYARDLRGLIEEYVKKRDSQRERHTSNASTKL